MMMLILMMTMMTMLMILISGCGINDNSFRYQMVVGDGGFYFVPQTACTWIRKLSWQSPSDRKGSMENRRRPKGQPDGRRPKGQPIWAQASAQTLYEPGNGGLRGRVAAVVGEFV